MNHPARSGPAVALFGVAAVALLAAAAWPAPSLNHDAALYLQCGQLLLGGARPYVDYVELNPPLTHYLHVVPAWTAGRLGVDVARTFHAMVGAAAVASALAVARLWPGATRWTAATLWIGVSALLLRQGEFGQREHLFVLAAAPWLLLRFARCTGRAFGARRLPSGVVAAAVGVGCAATALLKPHFVLVLLAAEGLLVGGRARRRGIRFALRPLFAVEVILFAAVGAAYGGHFLLLPAECRAEFFGRWIPFIARHYRVYDTPWAEVIRTPFAGVAAAPVWLGVVAGAVLLALHRSRRAAGRAARLLAAGGLLALGLYFVQHKGWTYHLIPAGALTAAAVAGVLPASAGSSGRVSEALARAAPCAALAAVAVLLSFDAVRTGPARREGYERFAALIREHVPPGERVAFLSTSVNPAYPALIYADRLCGTRYPCAFPIAMLYDGVGAADPFPYRPPRDQTAEERTFLGELAEDIAAHRPVLVFVQAEERFQACPPGFRIDDYLDRAGWTRTALAGYARIYGQFGGYAVYRRRS